MIKVLFLAANPLNTESLRIDEEIRSVKKALRLAQYGKSFDLQTEGAVRYSDLQDLLLHHGPDIVHFSGHGANSGELIIQDEEGLAYPISIEALSNLFATVSDSIRCVVLNACYSEDQADAIAKHIDCVVGMSDAITDDTALDFSTAFYRGLAYGRDLESAFKLALNQIDLSGSDESSIPHLLASSVNPAEVVFDYRPDSADAEPPTPGEQPYLGLQYYDVDDADRFFGREELTADLVGYLRDYHFLAVIGASGSGKSSLVRAGIVPALSSGDILSDGTMPPQNSSRWPVRIITPTARPLRSLAADLSNENESTAAQSTLMEQFSQSGQTLDLAMAKLAAHADGDRVLLVVDQFEELFTLCDSDLERRAFLDNLLTAAAPDGVTTLIITLRADFYHRCADFADLRLMLERNQRYIGAMSPDELRSAIVKPAELGGWEFEAGLVDQMLASVVGEPGALPLLSHALLETWNRRQGRRMTFAGYYDAGGVRGAIARRADAEFADLDDHDQAIAKSIFVRLTELDEDAADTRRRVERDELLDTAENSAAVDAVIDTLADARLITVEENEVEVAHEALIREWPLLRKWLDEDREGLQIHRRMTEASDEWIDLGRDQNDLFRGTRLDQTLKWAAANAGALNKVESEFLEASNLQFEVEEAAREAARQQELIQAQELAEEANARRDAEAERAREAEARQQVEAERAAYAEQSSKRLRRRAWYLGGALTLTLVAMTIALIAMMAVLWYWDEAQVNLEEAIENAAAAERSAQEAERQRLIAEARLAPFEAAMSSFSPSQRLNTAQELAEAGDSATAAALLQTVLELSPELISELQADELSTLARAINLHAVELDAAGDEAGADSLRTDSMILLDAAREAGEIIFDEAAAEYVFIAAGNFLMGSDDADELASDDEKPPKPVSLNAFWMMRTEVTNAQYARCVASDVCQAPLNDVWNMLNYSNGPVTDIPWSEAAKYADWVGGRLPTEAEWEYACRGTDGRIYPWGNEEPSLERLNYDYNSPTDIMAVGSYPPGANGLFDMAGNVTEWTATPYNVGDGDDATTESLSGTLDSAERVVRGSDYGGFDDTVRCAYREGLDPETSYDYVGFRVIMPAR